MVALNKTTLLKVCLCRGGGGSTRRSAAASYKHPPSSGGRVQSLSFCLPMAENMICVIGGDPLRSTAIVSPIGYLTNSLMTGVQNICNNILQSKSFYRPMQSIISF